MAAVADALQLTIRRKRIDAAFRGRALQDLRLLPVTFDFDSDVCAWLRRLAERVGSTMYEASYLELAQKPAIAGRLVWRRPGATRPDCQCPSGRRTVTLFKVSTWKTHARIDAGLAAVVPSGDRPRGDVSR
jgi:hypothetical protein